MPCSLSSAAGPTPESCSSCGDWIEPPASSTSRRARMRRDRAVLRVFEPDRALAVEEDALGERVHLDLEVRPFHRRAQIGDRGRAAAHLAHGELIGADAFLLGAVEIGVGLVPGLLRGGDKGVVQFVRRRAGRRPRAARRRRGTRRRRAPGPRRGGNTAARRHTTSRYCPSAATGRNPGAGRGCR